MHLLSRLALSAGLCAATVPSQATSPAPLALETVAHLHDYEVVELRRYTTRPGRRDDFVRYFDTYFPEAFEQLGAIVFGQFTERDAADRMIWLRGFKDIQARPVVSAAFYYGPLWREHRVKVNDLLPDSDNVLLLRPLHPGQGVTVLPAVDPVLEPHGAKGVVVAQVFAVKQHDLAAFSMAAELAFAAYRVPTVHSAGILVTLDVPNNFPQLPVRKDGPWLVWLGVCHDETALKALMARMDSTERALGSTALREPVERIVMHPTTRSRLRWLDADAAGEASTP